MWFCRVNLDSLITLYCFSEENFLIYSFVFPLFSPKAKGFSSLAFSCLPLPSSPTQDLNVVLKTQAINSKEGEKRSKYRNTGIFHFPKNFTCHFPSNFSILFCLIVPSCSHGLVASFVSKSWRSGQLAAGRSSPPSASDRFSPPSKRWTA